MNVAVLGAGLVGSAIIKDLAQDSRFSVKAVDVSEEALRRLGSIPNVTTQQADLSTERGIREAITNTDYVALAVPGFMGHEALRTVIDAGVDVVDISFFPEDPFDLDRLAKDRGVIAVVDCGVAPGLCNIWAGDLDRRLDHLTRYVCYVGGLPKKPEWPYGYRSVFSPIDVIAEYTRPARLVENGEQVTREALTEIETIDFPGVGALEAFNTDGLRSLMLTMDAPDMKEKTLRWPGHAELMRVFRETGFFSEDPLEVRGSQVAPIDVVSRLMFDAWRMREGEEDMTVLQVIVEGEEDGVTYRHTLDLLDSFDKVTGVTSMARTTGYTCSLVLRLLAEGLYDHKGISPPEYVGREEGCWDALAPGYEARGIMIKESVEVL